MCESRVYLAKDGKLEQLMNNVVIMRPEENGKIFLVSLLGEQQLVEAKIKEIKLLEHMIILENN